MTWQAWVPTRVVAMGFQSSEDRIFPPASIPVPMPQYRDYLDRWYLDMRQIQLWLQLQIQIKIHVHLDWAAYERWQQGSRDSMGRAKGGGTRMGLYEKAGLRLGTLKNAWLIVQY